MRGAGHGIIASYSSFHLIWEVITEDDGIEVSYRRFRKREIAEAFEINKLAHADEANIRAIEKMKRPWLKL